MAAKLMKERERAELHASGVSRDGGAVELSGRRPDNDRRELAHEPQSFASSVPFQHGLESRGSEMDN
jgi:hypothetical protein